MKTYNQFIQEFNVFASPGLRRVIKGVEQRERLTGGGPAPTRPKPTVDVGTTDNNSRATKLKVEPYKKPIPKDPGSPPGSSPGDVYIKRTPGDGLHKIKLDKEGLPIPGQYGVR